MKNNLNHMKIEQGSCKHLGALWDGKGVNFAIYSKHAEMVELCLFSDDGEEFARIKLDSKTDDIWHCYLPGIMPGQHYGYRIYGPYEPHKGLRFNSNKLLLDPYCKAISGELILTDVHYDYDLGNEHGKFVLSNADSAKSMPKSVVIDSKYDWENDTHPCTSWSDTIIYELHVKGYTMLNKKVPEHLRGTYAGLCSEPVLKYLKSLGITAVELLPIHHSVSEKRLTDHGLTNYWGYNTIGFFTPHSRYSSSGENGEQVIEFKNMVKAFHREGIEVILDVVYNHTAESGATGPTLSFRGIDNLSYYWLQSDNLNKYENFTGTGNTIKTTERPVIRLIKDSLKYWVQEMHVDGFRFDLATALGRHNFDFHRHHELFQAIYNDPVLSTVKLIAEPWDIGPGGYQVGDFPDPFSEWNDKFRNTVRRFWRGDVGQIADMGYRLSGSSDLYGLRSKGSHTSINYICSHDGFTLQDLVSFNDKHNLDNLEENNDGTNGNFSYNYGHEGPAHDKEITSIREKQKRNLLATLFLSQGTPMLMAGDEFGRTQNGNNNAYCQDNRISWVNWAWGNTDQDLMQFTKTLIELRKSSAIFTKGEFFNGHIIEDTNYRDLTWYMPDGGELTLENWQDSNLRSISFVMTKPMPVSSDNKQKILDSTFMIILNSSDSAVEFSCPKNDFVKRWETIINTDIADSGSKKKKLTIDDNIVVSAKSLLLLKPAKSKLLDYIKGMLK